MGRAKRGNVFRFLESDGTVTDKMVLVISPDWRSQSKIVSGLMLGTKSSSFDDETWLSGQFSGYVIHAGLLTYVRRALLGEQVGAIKPEEVESILYDIRIHILGDEEGD